MEEGKRKVEKWVKDEVECCFLFSEFHCGRKEGGKESKDLRKNWVSDFHNREVEGERQNVVR